MGVADAHQVHQALDGAVLAGRAVEGVKHHVRLHRGEHLGEVAIHVDAGDAVAEALQRIGDAGAAGQRHLALGRPTAHENGDVEGLNHQSSPSPRRRPGSQRDPP